MVMLKRWQDAKSYIKALYPSAKPVRMISTGLWVIDAQGKGDYDDYLNVGAESVAKAWLYAEKYQTGG